MKRFLITSILVFPLLYLLQSCQEKLKDFKPSGGINPKVVIDAFISDSIGGNYIVVTQTKDLLDQNPVPPINNAVVVLTDGQGLVDTFKLAPFANGYYFPSKVWNGVPGRTYTLKVLAAPSSGSSQLYTATSTMPNYPNPFKIDSLQQDYKRRSVNNAIRVLQPSDSASLRRNSFNTLNYNGVQFLNVGDTLIGVRMFAFKDITYRVNVITKVFRNNLSFKSNNIKINNLSQVPVNSFFVNPPAGGGPPQSLNFAKGDTVTVVLAGIPDDAFEYFNSINSVNANDGGLFNSPPGNPKSSFDNGALGCFRAVRLTSKTIIIK